MALPEVKPDAKPFTVVLPVPTGVTVALAAVCPARIVTLVGTVATVVSALNRLIICPPDPAGTPIVTVSDPGVFPERLSGLGDKVMVFVPAITVTVVGRLLL